MGNKILIAAFGFLLGVLVTAASYSYWKCYLPNNHAIPVSITLAEPQSKNIILYAELKNGFLVGKYFNENPEITVTQITVETVPKGEKNPFNKFTPRIFNIDTTAQPRKMSSEFKVETGL